MPRRLSKILIITAVTLFIAFDLLLLWVATGPRLLNGLTPYIEKALTAADGSYAAKIGETWLTWGTWRHPIDIRLRNVNVLTKEGEVFSSFPEISLGIDLLALPLGQVLPTSIRIDEPVISLFQHDDRSIRFGFGTYDLLAPPPEQQTPIPDAKATPAPSPEFDSVSFAALLSPLLKPDSGSPLRSLRRIAITNANVSIGNVAKGVFFRLTEANIQAKKSSGGSIKLLISGDMHYEEHLSAVGAVFIVNADEPTIDGSIDFDTLVPGLLGRLFADNPIFKTFNVPLSGKIGLSIDKTDKSVKRLIFDLNGGGGYISSEYLADSLPINAFHVEGQLSNNAADIQIDALSATIDKSMLVGNGVLNLSGDNTSVRAYLSLQNVSAANVKLFWPPGLAPISREWVLENITHGTVPHADAHVNIQSGDLAKPILPKEAVDASITLEGATIRYLPEHPPVSNVRSIIRIDGVGLHADITGADYLQSTKLSNGKLAIDDLNADNPYITVGFDAAITAKDAVALLKLPRLQHAKTLNLDADVVQGTATGHAELGFSFYAPVDEKGKPGEPDITFDIAADLKNFVTPQLLRRFDIKDGNGSLTINTDQLQFKGSGVVNGATASQTDVIYKFKPDSDGFDTMIDVAANAPTASLPKFGYPDMPFGAGTLGVKATLKQGPKNEVASASLDLTNAELDIAAIGWKKPSGEAASFDIQTQKNGDVLDITSMKLAGQNVSASGSAALTQGFTDIRKISLDKIKVGSTDLDRLHYEYVGDSLKLEAMGKSLDLSGWIGDESSDEGDISFANFPAVEFKADIAQLTLSNRGSVRDFKGEMRCDKRICHNANIVGKVGDNKDFYLRILRNPKGTRQLSLHAPDASAFLKAFGIFPNVEGGALSLTGDYKELAQGSVLQGKFIIVDYTVKKAPILAKILSLTSLTGVLDLLQGNGISFTKLTAPFTLQNDIVTFKKAKAYGGSIGITADGTLQFPKRVIDISGTVVPAYALNNMIGKVPVVGTLLTGGEGKGVFGFDYRVKGTEKEPDVSVNPLSILKPGFLRGLFEGPEEKEEN